MFVWGEITARPGGRIGITWLYVAGAMPTLMVDLRRASGTRAVLRMA